MIKNKDQSNMFYCCFLVKNAVNLHNIKQQKPFKRITHRLKGFLYIKF